MVRPAVIQSVEQCVADAGLSTDNQVDEIWESMPSFVTQTADLFVSKEEMKTEIRRSYNKNIDTVSTVVADLGRAIILGGCAVAHLGEDLTVAISEEVGSYVILKHLHRNVEVAFK